MRREAAALAAGLGGLAWAGLLFVPLGTGATAGEEPESADTLTASGDRLPSDSVPVLARLAVPPGSDPATTGPENHLDPRAPAPLRVPRVGILEVRWMAGTSSDPAPRASLVGPEDSGGRPGEESVHAFSFEPAGRDGGWTARHRVRPGAYRLRLEAGERGTGDTVELRLLPPGDGFEPNDDSTSARPLPRDGPVELHLLAGDEDWFGFQVSRSGLLAVGIERLATEGDAPGVELSVLPRETAGAPPSWMPTGTDDLRIFDLGAGSYWVRIRPAGTGETRIRLRFDVRTGTTRPRSDIYVLGLETEGELARTLDSLASASGGRLIEATTHGVELELSMLEAVRSTRGETDPPGIPEFSGIVAARLASQVFTPPADTFDLATLPDLGIGVLAEGLPLERLSGERPSLEAGSLRPPLAAALQRLGGSEDGNAPAMDPETFAAAFVAAMTQDLEPEEPGSP